MFKIVILLILLALYAHLYLHFIVNPNNECTILHDINKEDITNTVYVKQPFIFDASLLRKELKVKDCNKKSEPYGDIYDVSYASVPILEPYVRFSSKRTIVHFNKKKKWLDTNNSCRTFYRFHKGTFEVSCIHPKYKDLVSSKELKEHPKLIRLTLHQDSILFLPPYWHVMIRPLEKNSDIDKIQYFTPLNYLANSISKIGKFNK
jgi:hypothetical protein